MNQQQQHTEIAPIATHPSAHLVQVDGKTYQIVELQPQPIQPQPLTPKTLNRSTLFDDPLALIGMGVGVVFIAGVGGWIIGRTFIAAPVAPTPSQPQTVIVQPPIPERKPYYRRDCRPAGALGWGSECSEERGWQ